MPEGSVKLGLMPPLTGLVGMYGTEVSRAGQIACQEVNERGGVLGRPLELIIEDDGSLPESAVRAANRLVDRHRCVALVGNLLSNSRIAVAYRVAEPRNIPYLNFSFYEGSILSRYFFHFAALPNQQIDRMIPYMRARYGPRMFFAGNSYEWPRGSIDAAKRVLAPVGGEVVGEKYLPIGMGTDELERLLDEVAAADPDVFVPYFAGEDQLRLLTRFTERGMKGMAVVMGHYDEVMASLLPPAVREGYFSSNTYFMTVDTPGNRDYLARLAAWPGVDGLWPKGNGITTNFGEGTYLCVKAFALAANQAGSLDAEALVDALATVQVASPQGDVRMDPATHHARVNTYLSRCQADGRFALIEAFGAIDPVIPERYRHQRIHPHLEDDIRLQARMLEQMSDAVLLLHSDSGKIVYANPGAERMFGYGRGEMIGWHVSALNAPRPDDPWTTANQILALLRGKGAWEGDIRNVRKDGTPFWTSVRCFAFTHPLHGEVWMTVQRDITQIKILQEELESHRDLLEERVAERTQALEETKERLRLFTEIVPAGIAMFDRDMRYIAASRRYAEGLRIPLDGLVGRTYHEVFPRDPERWREIHRRCLAGATEHCDEDRFVRADGTPDWVAWEIRPWRTASGSVGGLVLAWKSITARKQAADELEAAKAEAERANLSKSKFIAAASHDLRQPVQSLVLLLEALRGKVEGGPLARIVTQMNVALDGLSALLSSILDMSKFDAGVVVPDFQDVAVARILDRLAEEYAVRGAEKSVVVTSAPTTLAVRADPALLERVLRNLVENALRYTAAGKILIGARRRGDSVRLDVIDTGIGIAPQHLPLIFDEFHQIGNPSRDSSQGLGLGLAIVQRAVRLLGGRVEVASRPDRGSRFSVLLPRATAAGRVAVKRQGSPRRAEDEAGR